MTYFYKAVKTYRKKKVQWVCYFKLYRGAPSHRSKRIWVQIQGTAQKYKTLKCVVHWPKTPKEGVVIKKKNLVRLYRIGVCDPVLFSVSFHHGITEWCPAWRRLKRLFYVYHNAHGLLVSSPSRSSFYLPVKISFLFSVCLKCTNSYVNFCLSI